MPLLVRALGRGAGGDDVPRCARAVPVSRARGRCAGRRSGCWLGPATWCWRPTSGTCARSARGARWCRSDRTCRARRRRAMSVARFALNWVSRPMSWRWCISGCSTPARGWTCWSRRSSASHSAPRAAAAGRRQRRGERCDRPGHGARGSSLGWRDWASGWCARGSSHAPSGVGVPAGGRRGAAAVRGWRLAAARLAAGMRRARPADRLDAAGRAAPSPTPSWPYARVMPRRWQGGAATSSRRAALADRFARRVRRWPSEPAGRASPSSTWLVYRELIG